MDMVVFWLYALFRSDINIEEGRKKERKEVRYLTLLT